MRVENGHELATICRLSMLLSDASCCCEAEALSKADIQTVFAAAISTKEISINKQREREAIPLGKSARAAPLIRKQSNAKQSNAMQCNEVVEPRRQRSKILSEHDVIDGEGGWI